MLDLHLDYKGTIMTYARAAVLAGLALSESSYSEPLAEGIEGAYRTIRTGEVIRSICKKYGIEAPVPESPKPKFSHYLH